MLFAAAILAYAFVALWLNRVMADQPFTLPFALRETGRGRDRGERQGLGSPLRDLRRVVPALGAAADASAPPARCSSAWLAPWRYRHALEAHHRRLTRDLVAAWGVDTLAPFVLRGDKSYFFDDDEAAFVAYKVVGGVAIVSGDPIGPPEPFRDAVGAFLQFARSRAAGGSRSSARPSTRCPSIASTGCTRSTTVTRRSSRRPVLARGHGAIRKVRQSVHRLERAGFTADGRCARAQLDASRSASSSRSSRAPGAGAQPERGFVMALDTLFRLDDEHALFVLGRAPDGSASPVSCTSRSAGAARALSLSSMPRLRTTPNGFNEWLVCVAIEWAREHGFDRVSLELRTVRGAARAGGGALRVCSGSSAARCCGSRGTSSSTTCCSSTASSSRTWQRRFVVYEKRLDLPRVGIAALAAEAYLPFGKREPRVSWDARRRARARARVGRRR